MGLHASSQIVEVHLALRTGPNERLDSSLVNIAADVKSLLASNEGRVRSFEQC
jgi:hypothetical protein